MEWSVTSEMSDPAAPVPKRPRLSPAGQGEGGYNTPTYSEEGVGGDPLEGHSAVSSSDHTDLRRKTPTTGLLHLLDNHWITRRTTEPWNTSGAYCDIYVGDHPVLGKVAMKRPRTDENGCTPSQLKNFRSEGRIWKDLRHPNILQFVGMIDMPSQVWLVSIFADNGTLHEYMRKHPKVDRHSLVLQLTSGLAYLHFKKVVHGDLKSSNLLISNRHVLLIGDFGLSKPVGTLTGASKKGDGSARWQAPELFREACLTKTPLSDLYAYGIIISEILSGKIPFEEFTNPYALRLAVLEKNLRPPPVPTESLQGKSYAILWTVAGHCWDAEPSRRPAMRTVCRWLSLDYTTTVGDAIPSGLLHTKETDDGCDPSELVSAHIEAVSPIEDVSSDPQPISQPPFLSSRSDGRLIQLLGNAEYGDTGNMKADGLCLDGTRVEHLETLAKWADDPSASEATVMLLEGQAGRGKSTIARSVISRFRKRWGCYASSGIFHFQRYDEHFQYRQVLLALALQLGCNGDPRVKEAILTAVQDHQNVAGFRLEEQFEILLVQPLRTLESNPPRILLVIDALDECSDHAFISALLSLFATYAASLPSTFKILLTSRPEEQTLGPLHASFRGALGKLGIDAVDLALIDRDIRAYFTIRLSDIQRDFPRTAILVPPEAINELVGLSQGLFQWARGAMDYVRQRPQHHLTRLTRSTTVVLSLPLMYNQILSTAFPHHTDATGGDDHLICLIQHVVGSLVVAHLPMSRAVLEYLWDRHPRDPSSSEATTEILDSLRSMLTLPSSNNDPIHFIHATALDFFTNPDHCEDPRFRVIPHTHHARLADICCRRMKRDLPSDVGEINDPSEMNSEVLDLKEQDMEPGLQYSYRSWLTHYSKAGSVELPGSTAWTDSSRSSVRVH